MHLETTKPLIRAQWAKEVESEEGCSIIDVIRRERSFNVPDSTIADSFGVSHKGFNQALRRLRDKGFDV